MELKEQVAKNTESIKTAHHRLDTMERKVEELTNLHLAVCRLSEKMDTVADDVTEVKQELKEVREKPARRWESMVAQALTLVVAAVVGMMLSHLGY